MQHFEIPLSGLNCMGCARKVEKALTENNQVTILDLSPTHIVLETEERFSTIHRSIKLLGYDAGTTQHYRLAGLNCGRCVSKLHDALLAHPLIAEAEVSKESLTLTSLLCEQQILDLVSETGYQAFSPTVEPAIKHETPEIVDATASIQPEQVSTHPPLSLLIQGMTCASCVSSVEKALLSVPGVMATQVNLAEQSATIYHSSIQESFESALLDAIKQAGYQAEFIDDLATQHEKQALQQQREQKHFQKSAIAGMAIGAPLMLWGILGGNMMIRNSSDQIAWGIVGIICFALLATAGKSFFVNAWQAFTHRRATMDTLVALGTGAAWLFSMLVVVYPELFPLPSRHVYFEASAMIVGLISLGHYIESKAKAKTTHALKALLDLQPKFATQLTENGDITIPVEAIQLGMKLRIKPGEQIPVDGKVLDGESFIDESMLTGEPIPLFKSIGTKVSTGTLNQDGSLVIEATSIGNDTMLARIIQMVRQAQSSKPAIAKLADQISAVFVPVVVMIAIFSALVWFFIGPDPKASYMLVVATTVLIIACPCALGLATPLSVTVGIGKAAEMGILIKDADVLQSASKINTVVFDKTGTLTQGKPVVQTLEAYTTSTEHLIDLLFSIERHSEHPLAKAICHYTEQHHGKALKVTQFQNLQGKGVAAMVDDQPLQVASTNYLAASGIDMSSANTILERAKENAWTTIGICLNNQLLGTIALADAIKGDAKQAIELLKANHIQTVMLTGDNQTVADAIAHQLGIDMVIAQVLPDQKAKHIQKLKDENRRVAMVGDGINDAPALALADIGIAMGSGSDVAIESAQMTLLNSSPVAVAKSIELSRATVKNMKQNLFGAFVYNSLGIPIAAGALYPILGILLSPVVAGAAMALSSITVVSNANRLRLFKTTIDS
ncbi:copper-translocating P-type ATPase [Vibrio sp. TRT 21S02]|uniref:heavy metal translocating P-type ATPase n=1 Tax=Vibrio sp. TRT 21S02 TaxID=3418507 RepID=UPI003CF03112